jgi:hypothetical protein
MTKQLLKNSEYTFTRSDKAGNEVALTLYIQYDRRVYTICQAHEESVFFGKKGTIEHDLLYADLCREIVRFVQKEFSE